MADVKNKLYVADNLDVLHGMNSNTVDLIYLDPPFNSKRMYSAPIGTAKGVVEAGFHDIWNWDDDVDIRLESFLDSNPHLFAYIDLVGHIHGLAMKAYLTFMAQRIIEMHRVLKDIGSLYLHCDPTASHYLKIILDWVFGKDNFRNEVVWSYRRWTAGNKNFQRMHDIIFRYTKSDQFAFNVQYEPYGDWIKKDYSYTDKDGRRWRWHTVKGNRYKVYLEDENKGVKLNDVWQIPYLGSTAKERTGYPTQKPLALLDRIISASSNPGDLVMDPFCGCATTCVAAQNLHRKWIGIDVSDVAVDLVATRLQYDEGGQVKMFQDFLPLKTLPIRTDQTKLTWDKKQIREHFYGKQNGSCNGCGEHFTHARHFHIDHIHPKSKEGGWVLENLQLLCGSCNSIKGNRPMEYLLKTIKARRSQQQIY
ncbi:DNA methyltransferase [Candidatus Spongiihabitans sp.]|uniref:DNA methyltransferase n=1 Tax=Candidatus Spongiihabitans sp. TaxID=3101308 RepID=UPI003C79FEC8